MNDNHLREIVSIISNHTPYRAMVVYCYRISVNGSVIELKRFTTTMPYRKISKCQQGVADLIQKVGEILNFRIIEYTIHLGCDDIDSFYSGLYNVQIKGLRDGQKIKHNVVIKHHVDPETRSVFRESYKRETSFYIKIVPLYLEIQQNFKIIEGLRIKLPNCIFANDEYDKETVVVMGLIEDGFKIHDRLHKTDLDHVILVIKYLAKLHAFSFILEKWKPEEFEKITKLYYKDVQYADPSRQSKAMKSFYDASVSVVSNPIAKEKLEKLGPVILSVLHKCTLPVPRNSTICHGDCWNNNILYKYKNKRPVDVIFVDFQLVRFASPVTDIAYFLYMSADEKFLTKHYETVLDIYYGTLAAMLRECNLNIEEIYPKKIFEHHLREYSVLGLVEALISMMIITAPFDEALKMTEIKYQFCNEGIGISQDNVLFKERVNEVVDDFFSRNYSLDAVLSK